MSKRFACLFRNQQGLTLLELLLALAMLGLLTGLAWPNYQQQSIKSRRVEGQSSLMSLHVEQTRWYSIHNQYAQSFADLGWPAQSPHGHYRLEISEVNSAGYTLRALAQGSQAQDPQCAHLQLRQLDTATVLLGTMERSEQPDCWKL